MIQAVFVKALLAVLSRVLLASCGEQVIEWFLFKFCELLVQSTKTPCDDEFYAMVKTAYNDSKGRNNEGNN